MPKGFYSTIFLVPKPNGTFRLILNLSNLNKFVKLERFKMDNMDTVISALTPEVWSVRLDLQDAYFQIPIHQDSRHLLRFVLGSKVFQFRVLPFGLCSAPYLFTQVVNSVAALLRQRGINILTYLDDWLILCHSKDRLQTQVSVTLQILSQLGFVINRTKSDLIPTQTFQYLGVQFDTSKNYMAPSMENRQKLVDKIELIRSAKAVSAQTLLALLGSMNFAAQLVWRGRLHMRPIQMWLLSRWKIDRGQLTDQIAVTDLLVHHLSWWTEERLQRGRHLFAQKPAFTIQSDASLEGWGGVLEGSTTRGLWSAGDRSLHINNLELMALFNCLKEFRHKIQGSTVLCQLDNSTAVWYLKKEGGTKSADLCLLVWEMLHWCDQNNIQLVVRHLPGHLNILADQLSRKSVHTEWSLHPSVFKAIVKKTDHPPVIDLFATSLNFKLPSYFSPVPDPNAMAVDALSQKWTGMTGYAFPPIPILPLVLKKLREENCVIILIAPLWPKRSWFSMIMELLVESPLKLPQIPKLLAQNGLFHKNPALFNYHAWTLSGRSELREAFLKRQPIMLENASEIHQRRSIVQDGQSSVVGVLNNRLILSRSLQLN